MRIAVDGGSGREDDMLHTGLHHGVEQRERSGNIVGEVAGRLAHGFAHRDEGGEVNDGVALLLLHQADQRGRIGEIELMQPAGRHVVTIAFGEVVHNGDVVALLEQQADGVGADIAGSAGNENFSRSHGV